MTLYLSLNNTVCINKTHRTKLNWRWIENDLSQESTANNKTCIASFSGKKVKKKKKLLWIKTLLLKSPKIPCTCMCFTFESFTYSLLLSVSFRVALKCDSSDAAGGIFTEPGRKICNYLCRAWRRFSLQPPFVRLLYLVVLFVHLFVFFVTLCSPSLWCHLCQKQNLLVTRDKTLQLSALITFFN